MSKIDDVLTTSHLPKVTPEDFGIDLEEIQRTDPVHGDINRKEDHPLYKVSSVSNGGEGFGGPFP